MPPSPYLAIPVLLVLYLSTLCHYVLPGDFAEFVSAAHRFGLAHPTGYPVYVLLTGSLSRLVPVLAPELTINALSMVYCLLAVICLARGACEMFPRSLSLALPFLLFGLTPSIWHYSTVAEVYTLHGLFFSGVVLCMLSFERRGGMAWLKAAALLAGLSAGNHATSVLFFPGLFLWMALALRARRGRLPAKTLAGLALTFTLGASSIFLVLLLDRPGVYNYLAIYSIEFPLEELETPLGRFWWLLSAEQFHAVPGLRWSSLLRAPESLWRVLLELWEDGPFLLVLGGLGLLPGLRSGAGFAGEGRFLIFSWVSIVLTLAYFATYPAFEPVFFIAGYALLALGLCRLLSSDLPRWARGAAIPAALGFAVVWSGSGALPALAARNTPVHQVESGRLIESLPRDAVVFAMWQKATLLYFHQWVRGARPDVTILSSAPRSWPRLRARYPGRPHYLERVPGITRPQAGEGRQP